MISGTIEPMGTTLAGQSIEAFYISIEHIKPLSVGLNCATGPEFMRDHIRSLSEILMATLVVIRTQDYQMKKGITMSRQNHYLKSYRALPKKGG